MLEAVSSAFDGVPVTDMHTHLFPPSFEVLRCSGIDELLTYHYLEAEYFRLRQWTPEDYFALPKTARAEAIWDALFVRRAPISEACRGVLTVLTQLGLSTEAHGLREARDFFRSRSPERHTAEVFRLAGVSQVVMTNDPLDPVEAAYWETGTAVDPRFRPALRLDRVLSNLGACFDSVRAARRFLDGWMERMSPLYLAISLPDTFAFPETSSVGHGLRDVFLPCCADWNVPLALMIGVKRGVNPRIGVAADGSGRASLQPLIELCTRYPDQRFLVTLLSLENQHELCVVARKLPNLMPFGCWWFLNTSSLVTQITRQRIELLGATFVAQHSDARVLEQLIYKWRDARRSVADALHGAYQQLAMEGRPVTIEQIAADATRLLTANFNEFVCQPPATGLHGTFETTISCTSG